jgi:hypothetical protein
MSNFKVVQMEGTHWAVFLVNPNDPNDRYILTSSLESESEAEHFRQEFGRINDIRDQKSVPMYDLNPPLRAIQLEDDDLLEELKGRSKNEP